LLWSSNTIVTNNEINNSNFYSIHNQISNWNTYKFNNCANSGLLDGFSVDIHDSNNIVFIDNRSCNNQNGDMYIYNGVSIEGNSNYMNVVNSDENWPIYGVHYCHCNEQWVNGVCVID